MNLTHDLESLFASLSLPVRVTSTQPTATGTRVNLVTPLATRASDIAGVADQIANGLQVTGCTVSRQGSRVVLDLTPAQMERADLELSKVGPVWRLVN